MKIAVIKTGGKQYLVKKGDVVKIEKIKNKKEGEELEIKEVLLISDEKGEKFQIGTPFISGAKVLVKIIEEGRDKKIKVVKYRPKTRYSKVQGHRQNYMKIQIKDIIV